jgi:hypothetical protein
MHADGARLFLFSSALGMLLFALSPRVLAIDPNIRLSPSGMKLVKEKLDAYPAFDHKKFVAEANRLFPLVKKGTVVIVHYRNHQAKGAFRGYTDSTLKIGETEVPRIDLTRKQLASFIPSINAEEKKHHVERAQAGYKAKRTLFEHQLLSPLIKKYPRISKKTFARIFSKLKDRKLADDNITALLDFYDKKLPVPDGMSQKQFLRGVFFDFMNSRTDIVLDGFYVISMAEKQRLEAEREKIKEAKKAKLAARTNYPKTATPVFAPDGGPYSPNVKISISSPTEGAEIHYTTDGSPPTEDSPVFKQPIPAAMRMRLKAIAMHPEYNDSDVACMDSWKNSGLFASYFNRSVFTGQTVTRLDKTLSMKWWGAQNDHLPPEFNSDSDFFSVLWTGQLIPPKTGEYTFFLQGDDGVRMWLNGKVFIDGWCEQPKTSYQETIRLVAGKPYNIKVALTECCGAAVILLEWRVPGSSERQIVPSNCFSAAGPETDKVKKWNQMVGGRYVNRKKMLNPGSYQKRVLLKSYVSPQHKEHVLQQLKLDWEKP